MTSFDQSQHPRNAAGTSKGGQFAAKQNSVPEAELSEDAMDALYRRAEAIRARTNERVAQLRVIERQALTDQVRAMAEATRDFCRLFSDKAATVEYAWSEDTANFLGVRGVYDVDGNEVDGWQFQWDDELYDFVPFSYETEPANVGKQPWLDFDEESVTINLTQLPEGDAS